MGVVRFSLAIVVLMDHAGFPMYTIRGLASVEAFFILSGTFMAAVWQTKYCRLGSSRPFYLNRIMRLWPTYLLLVALTCAAYVLLGRPSSGHRQMFNLFNALERDGLSALNIALVAETVLVFGQDVVSVVEHLHYMLPVRQSWSIASELLFYCLVPFVFGRLKPVALCAAAAVLITAKTALLFWQDWRSAYFIPVGNFGYFLYGGALYVFSQMAAISEIKGRHRGIRGVATLGILVVVFGGGEASLERGGILKHALFVVSFSLAIVMLFDRVQTRLDSVLGNLSYGIYLNHFIFVVVATVQGLRGVWLLAFTLCTSVVMALIIEKVVQRPIDQWRHAYVRRVEGGGTSP